MDLVINFHKTLMGNSILLNELILGLYNRNNIILCFKNYFTGHIQNILQSNSYNYSPLDIIINNKTYNLILLVKDGYEEYAQKIRKNLEDEKILNDNSTITLIKYKNSNDIREYLDTKHEYEYIVSSIDEYYNCINSKYIHICSDIIQYLVLYIRFFHKIKSTYNNYFHGFFSMLIEFRQIFVPLFIFWPLCFNIPINTNYILPLFKSVACSLMSMSLVGELCYLDEERFYLQNHDLEPLCSKYFISQKYSIKSGAVWIIIFNLINFTSLFQNIFSFIFGTFIGFMYFLTYRKSNTLRIITIGGLFVIINIIFILYYIYI